MLLTDYIFILTPFFPFFCHVSVKVGKCFGDALSHRGVDPGRHLVVFFCIPCSVLYLKITWILKLGLYVF